MQLKQEITMAIFLVIKEKYKQMPPAYTADKTCQLK